MKIAAGRVSKALKFMSFIAVAGVLTGASGHAAKAGALMDWLAGVGEEDDKIQYPERGPLVVPPSLSLPQPKASAAVANPAWPKDPDVERKRKAKEAALAPSDSGGKSRPLSVDEIRAGRKAGAGLVTESDSSSPSPSGKARPLTVLEMQALNDEVEKQQAAAKEIETVKGRVYLTDPPTVYRKKALLTPEMEEQAAAAGQPVKGDKPWYQFW